jgi:hypothetical protein
MALACQERENQKQHFYGWYDLGGVVDTPILAVYQARYKTRFILNWKKAVTYHAMIAFAPKEGVCLDEIEIKAILSYLNSSFVQLYIESVGRTTGAVGPVGFEVNQAEKVPIIDVKRISNSSKEELALLFDKLDTEARRIGGADKKENIVKLWDTVIAEIDDKITELLQLPEYLPEAARTLARIMMERRVARAEQPQPAAIKGSTEMPQIKQPEKRKREKKPDKRTMKLDDFVS